MNYTDFTLFCFGLGGVLIHNLTKINELKKANKFKTEKYFAVEWPAIAISVIILFMCVLGKKEVSQLEQAGKWLGFAFVTIGYMGQSLFIKFMGRANKALGSDSTDTPANP